MEWTCKTRKTAPASESVALNFAGQKPDSGRDGENLVRVTERMMKSFLISINTALAACSVSCPASKGQNRKTDSQP